MAGVIKGDVVIVPFPFSDLTQAKRRPALVIASLEGDDIILCQITSKTVKDRAEKNMHGAIKMHVQGMVEDGETIPESQSFAEYVVV